MKPILLLDIDGTLCPKPPLGSPHDILVEYGGFRGTLHPQTPKRVQELGKKFELVWATTWQKIANKALAPALGIPEIPYIEFRNKDPDALTRKLTDVKCYLLGDNIDRLVAWIDDELYFDSVRWAYERNAETLLLHTDSELGFTEEHFNQLMEFADKHS